MSVKATKNGIEITYSGLSEERAMECMINLSIAGYEAKIKEN
jgi:hypothetical protein